MINLPQNDLAIALGMQLERMVKFGYVKADKVFTDVVQLVDHDKVEARVALSFELDRDDLSSSDKIVEKLSEVLKSSIVESVCHKRQVEDLTKEITMLQNQIKELHDVVKELKPFKTHFDLQFELQHGKKRG